MGFVAEQTSAHATGTGNSIAITLNAVKKYSLVVVHIAVNNTETCTGVTDDKGNTYVLSDVVENGTLRVYQAYGVNIVEGTTQVSVAFSGTTASKRCGADEYSGGEISNAAIYDTRTTGTGSGTSLAVSTLTPASTGELIVATLRCSSTSANHTSGTNYTIYNGVNPTTTRSQYRLSSGASETAPSTIDVSVDWGEIATAFKPLSVTTNYLTNYRTRRRISEAVSK